MILVPPPGGLPGIAAARAIGAAERRTDGQLGSPSAITVAGAAAGSHHRRAHGGRTRSPGEPPVPVRDRGMAMVLVAMDHRAHGRRARAAGRAEIATRLRLGRSLNFAQ
jgi:hypothetical protein